MRLNINSFRRSENAKTYFVPKFNNKVPFKWEICLKNISVLGTYWMYEVIKIFFEIKKKEKSFTNGTLHNFFVLFSLLRRKKMCLKIQSTKQLSLHLEIAKTK